MLLFVFILFDVHIDRKIYHEDMAKNDLFADRTNGRAYAIVLCSSTV